MKDGCSLRNIFLYIAGIAFLALAKAKHTLFGYTSPKPFDISETERCIEYDIRVVEQWLKYLQQYTHSNDFLAGKNALELGPGSDLGIGLYLLSRGCAAYNACDVNNLAVTVPEGFYNDFLKRIEGMSHKPDISSLGTELEKIRNGSPSRLNYVVRSDFDLVSTFGLATIDLVFSQAAFEHFDDVNATISQLSAVCKPGAVLVVSVDLKTHSRWIRDKDPNNIYRYSASVYNAFRFRGIPNRVRPFQYKNLFEKNGWENVVIIPLLTLDDPDKCCTGLDKTFSGDESQMNYLSIMLCARKQA
jgi:SAM-dependent methyltransferase